MPGATQLEREGEVVSQVWEWWFLKFDLPLRNYGTPHTAPCTMAKLMPTHSPPPSTLVSPPLALFSSCHGLPPPRQTKRLTPRTQTLPPNPLTQLTPITPLDPHPDPRRCGTPLQGPMRYGGPDRDPMGQNGHGQHTETHTECITCCVVPLLGGLMFGKLS